MGKRFARERDCFVSLEFDVSALITFANFVAKVMF